MYRIYKNNQYFGIEYAVFGIAYMVLQILNERDKDLYIRYEEV